MKSLTSKQTAFVAEYLVDLNGAQAAIRAGYSPRTAARIASELLRKPAVAAAIEAAKAKRAERVEVSQDEVLRELLRILRTDLADAFDKDGKLKPPHELPLDLRRAVASIETDELFDGHGKDRRQVGVTRKLKFWPKDKAIELALKHLGILKDHHVHELGGSFADALKEARARAQRK